MGCCMSGSRTDNDNGEDTINPLTTAPDGTPIGQDGSKGGTIPYYGTPGGSMSGGGKASGGPYVGATAHSMTNYNPSKVSSDYISKMKSSNLDALSSQNESSGDPAKVHMDNNGYYAYGTYQLNSGTGSVNKFLQYEQVNNPDAYEKLMAAGGGTVSGQQSSEFQNAWASVTGSNSSFADDQEAFIKTTYYDKAVDSLEKSGVNVDNLSTGAKQIIWSTAVQYGAGTDVMTSALANVDKSNLTSTEFINTVSDYKQSTVSSYFKSSTSATQSSVAKRFASERVGALSNN